MLDIAITTLKIKETKQNSNYNKIWGTGPFKGKKFSVKRNPFVVKHYQNAAGNVKTKFSDFLAHFLSTTFRHRNPAPDGKSLGTQQLHESS